MKKGLKSLTELSIFETTQFCINAFELVSHGRLFLSPKSKLKHSSKTLSIDVAAESFSGALTKRIIADLPTVRQAVTSVKHNKSQLQDKLRCFISSIDTRAQRNFFFFQPVVALENFECPPYPYLPPLPPQASQSLTLVLDLDETLIHFDEAAKQILIRPCAQQFIANLGNLYELVIFTAAMQKVRLAH